MWPTHLMILDINNAEISFEIALPKATHSTVMIVLDPTTDALAIVESGLQWLVLVDLHKIVDQQQKPHKPSWPVFDGKKPHRGNRLQSNSNGSLTRMSDAGG